MKNSKQIFRKVRDFFFVFDKEPVSYTHIVCGGLVFAAVFYYTLQMPLDYGAHLNLALQFAFRHPIQSLTDNPYPLWHIVCVLLEKLFSIPGQYAAAFSSAIFVYLTYSISRRIILTYIHNDLGRKLASVFSAMLMFVQPIFIPWFNETLVYGQGSPNILYNPTSIAVKPFAILCVWLFIKLCTEQRDTKRPRQEVFDFLQLAFFQLLSVLAKPSFAQVCIPAVGIYLLYLLIKTKGRSIAFCLKTVISWVPAVIWIGIIFYLSFISETNSDGNGVVLSFFDVWKVYSPCIPISILLATFCPVLILILCLTYRKNIGNNTGRLGVYLSALIVLIGVFEYGFLMESGERMMHGNFSWGYNAGLGVIWTYATGMIVAHISDVKDEADLRTKGWSVAFMAFLAHFLFGIYYYFTTL